MTEFERGANEISYAKGARDSLSRRFHAPRISPSRSDEENLAHLCYFHEAVLRTAPEGICVCREIADFPYVEFILWNDRMTEITGYTKTEINKLGWYQSLYPNPELQQKAINRMAAMRNGDDLLREEWEIVCKGGERRLISISTSLVDCEGGDQGVLAFVGDQTERRRAEAAQRLRLVELNMLNEIGIICTSAATPDEVLTRTTNAISNTLYPDNCGFFLLDEKRAILSPHFSYVVSDSSVPLHDKSLGMGLIGKVAETGVSKRLDDVSSDPSYIDADIRTKSELCIPMKINSRVIGVMNVESQRSSAFTRADEQLLNVVVDLVGNTLGRLKMQESLRESQERLQLAIQASNMGLWDWDLKTNEVYFSPEWKRQIGFAEDELPNSYLEWSRRLHPDDAARTFQSLTDYFEGRSATYVVEFRFQHRDGSYRSIYARGEAIRDEQNVPIRMLGCHVDVTEKRRAMEIVHKIADAVAPTTGHEFFSTLVNNLCDACGVDYVAVCQIDPMDRRNIESLAISHKGRLVPGIHYDIRNTPCEESVSQSICYFDLDVQAKFPKDSMLKELDVRSYMGVPIHSSKGVVIGIATLLHSKSIPDPEMASSILRVVAVRAGAEIERIRSEEQLKRSEKRLLAVLDQAPHIAIQWYDNDGRVLLWNSASELMYGIRSADAIGKTLDELIQTPEEFKEFLEMLRNSSRSGKLDKPREFGFRRRDGSRGFCWSSTIRIPGDEKSDWFVCLDVDISAQKQNEAERIRLEEQVRHAQKLESLGVLAGGIAHDFNNLLTTILGFSHLAKSSLPNCSPALPYIDEALRGVHHASELTRQLLAYSGKGHFVVTPVNLSTVVADTARLLEVSVSKKCTLNYSLVPKLPCCEADAVQIQQIVMNLLINASEAVEDRGGTIRVATGKGRFRPDDFSFCFFDERRGQTEAVFIEVSDNGCGMDQPTMAKLFDPFFTTKFTGRGLGLAAALGIVRGHKGAIKVESELGIGTKFTVAFPISKRLESDARIQTESDENWRGVGTVLVVDDEDAIRLLVEQILKKRGIQAVVAKDGKEALQIVKERGAELSAVLLDMTMPIMDGGQAASAIREAQPNLPIVLMSGYDERTATQKFESTQFAGFIQKPFGPAAIIRVLQRLLDRVDNDS